MTLGTAAPGDGTHGHIPHGDTTDGTIRSISEVGMTLGITDTPESTEDGTEDGMEDVITDGMTHGITTTIITTIIRILSFIRKTDGTEAVTRQVRKGYSQAEHLQEEA
jgi:hypothetical protein